MQLLLFTLLVWERSDMVQLLFVSTYWFFGNCYLWRCRFPDEYHRTVPDTVDEYRASSHRGVERNRAKKVSRRARITNELLPIRTDWA